MSNDIIPLFSTPVLKTSVDVSSVDTALLKSLEYVAYPDNSGYSSKDLKILTREPFKELKRSVDQYVNTYCFELIKLTGCRAKHIQSWVNLHKPGNYSPKHYHSNSCFSGGVYLDVPEGSGQLVFCCPHLQPTYATGTVRPLTSEGNLFNADRWAIAVQKGDLTIFPSHLMHEVDVNKTDKDRYMIAFNYFLEGTIGDNTRQVKINVR